jgi:hypothetical protein
MFKNLLMVVFIAAVAVPSATPTVSPAHLDPLCCALCRLIIAVDGVSRPQALFLGCFRDNTNGKRTLQEMSFSTTENNSPDQCRAKCLAAGYSIMGRQYLGECFCGDGNHTYHSQGASTGCTCDAVGTNSLGQNVNCVYRITPAPWGDLGLCPYGKVSRVASRESRGIAPLSLLLCNPSHPVTLSHPVFHR